MSDIRPELAAAPAPGPPLSSTHPAFTPAPRHADGAGTPRLQAISQVSISPTGGSQNVHDASHGMQSAGAAPAYSGFQGAYAPQGSSYASQSGSYTPQGNSYGPQNSSYSPQPAYTPQGAYATPSAYGVQGSYTPDGFTAAAHSSGATLSPATETKPIAPAPAPAQGAAQASAQIAPPSATPSSAAPTSAPQTANTASDSGPSNGGDSAAAPPKPKKPRRSKVSEACKFCRKSHMSCDAQRPCSRCVKRNIAHLCCSDDATQFVAKLNEVKSEAPPEPGSELLGLDMITGSGEFDGFGLGEFLQSLNPETFYGGQAGASALGTTTPAVVDLETISSQLTPIGTPAPRPRGSAPGSPVNKTEKFFLTAADQKDGPRSDRLARVIHAKFEAGLLRPYNHVAGYQRLMRWMGENMAPASRQRTLRILSEFRPAFRAIASSLTDLDLVFIEEAFERLLLDYDRVFSSMGVPSCLWRRTGEIYKGNREFAALVGVPVEDLADGKLAIYELMAEESAVNYWEKYGNIAFDAGQKAVLTSCVLVNQSVYEKKIKKVDRAVALEEASINCCFSFTIRRDAYAIPSMIVGNFLRF